MRINFSQRPNIKNLLLLFLVVCIGFFIFGKVELGGYDEAAYLTFMKTLNENGINGIRFLIQKFPSDKVLLQGPSPLRILFPLLGTFICKLSGTCNIENLALISFISWIGIIIFGFFLFQKWFNSPLSTVSVVLVMTSPLGLALSRRALQDTLISFIFIAIIFFYHQYWLRRRTCDLFLLLVFLLAGFLTKESMFFLYPCFVAAGIYYRRAISLSFPKKIVAPFIIAPLLYLIISSWIAGGFKDYLAHYNIYSQMQDKIEYAVRFQKGPWFRYIIDLLLLSPLTYIFSFIGMLALIPDKHNQIGRNITTTYVLTGVVVFSFSPVLNLRIILFIDILLRALAVLGIIFISEKIRVQRYRNVFVILIFILVIVIDIAQFYKLFVKCAIYDPVTINLIYANGFAR